MNAVRLSSVRVHRTHTQRRGILRLALAFIAATTCTLCSAQIYITPTTPGWAFVEETPTGSGSFVNGPAGGPAGSSGSIQLTVGAPGGELFATASFAGIRVDQMAGISFDTFVVSSSIQQTATLQFDFDPGVVPPPVGYQGRAVFDPALLSPDTVAVGVWQTWDPMTQRGWWGTGSAATRLLAAQCPQAAPCTLAEILGFFPNSSVLAAGAFGFKLGNGNSAAVVSVDGFRMGTAGATGRVNDYRFALSVPAVTLQPVPTLNPVAMALLTFFAACIGSLALRSGALQRRR